MRHAAWLVFGFLLGWCAIPSSAQSEDRPNPAEDLYLAEGLEATVWATAPMFFNPTNIDVDAKGRIWVAEAVNYRNYRNNQAEKAGSRYHEAGDRIMVLEDTDGDGHADQSHVFVQDKDLVAPVGIGVFGSRIVVSCSPHLIVYTDVDGDARFDAAIDKKEILLTGFGGHDHDHSLHAVVAGPDGRWYFNVGNAGPHVVTDRSGWTLRAGSFYTGGSPHNDANKPGLKSDDGRIYVGGLAMSMRPDGTGLGVIGHNFRNNYEICLDSFGNVFQNDNDDQVVTCRTTWLMRYGNAGYAAADGSRSWQADRRPGQSTATAHWHQQDPGVIPYGDLYGAGSPTGMVVYEGDALGKTYQGMLLSCEAGRNVVWGYHVVPSGAGFELKRFSLVSTVSHDEPDYKWSQVSEDRRKWFRPSDVTVGIDGAIYVADWFDPIVGGHAMNDQQGTGVIYRITRKGTLPQTPTIDIATTVGQLAALRSPAVNVRNLGFEKLRGQGSQAVKVVWPLVSSGSREVRARAVWLLATLGAAGQDRVATLLDHTDAEIRLVAFRALLANEGDVVALTKRMASDSSAAIRRDAALALRDVPLEKSREQLVQIARQFDGKDRWYLEALGTGCDGKETEILALLLGEETGEPLAWSDSFASIVWRLHPASAVSPVLSRALASDLSEPQRKQAIDTLAFIPSRSAAEAMLEVYRSGPADLRSYVQWWIQFRSLNDWREYRLSEQIETPTTAPEIGSIKLPSQAAYSSDVIRAGELATIDVDITGAKTLYLVVRSGPDGSMSCDWSDWIEPRLIGPEGETPLTTLSWQTAYAGWGKTQVGLSCDGGPLLFGEKKIAQGIGTHSPSVIVYDIRDKGFTRFAASGCLDGGATRLPQCDPAVVFQVYHDGPTPDERSRALEKLMLDSTATEESRTQAAIDLALSTVGAQRLFALASSDAIPAEFSPVVSRHIFRNPDLSTRVVAGEYFARADSVGKQLPPIAEMAKLRGNAKHGRELFFNKAECHKCHQIGSEGRQVGPHLSSIGRKLDRTRLFDSVVNPSASIGFDYQPWLIVTDDGRSLSGFVLGEGDTVILKDSEGRQQAIDSKEIDVRKRLDVSLMPEASSLELTPQDLADLVEFLNQQTADE